jgi:hypothetical protein
MRRSQYPACGGAEGGCDGQPLAVQVSAADGIFANVGPPPADASSLRKANLVKICEYDEQDIGRNGSQIAYSMRLPDH